MYKKIISIILIVSSFALFAGCNTENSDSSMIESTDATSVSEDDAEYFKSEEDVFEIKTPYCSLYYPKKWKDSINIEVKNGEQCVVKFTAKSGAKEYALFDISFGEVENGFLLGSLPTDTENIDIYLVDYSGELPDDLPEEDKNNMLAMVEDVNVIISELVYRLDLIML